jgi:hypothetical protein
MMLSGDKSKTMNYAVEYWWDSETENRDRTLGNSVASWIGQNQRVLDKKRAVDVVKLLKEQFPFLVQVTARHAQLQSARLQ